MLRAVQIAISWFMIGVVWFLCYTCANWGSLPVLAVFMWLVLPIAHPCDYPNYRAWAQDWKNWAKKGYL